jgi:hypothetical protein
MKMFKKVSTLTLATTLFFSMVLSSAFAANVNVSALVHPKANMNLNFDAFAFEGVVGEAANTATYSLAAVNEPAPTIEVTASSSYTVYVSGTNFSDSVAGTTLNIERLELSIAAGGYSPVTGTLTQVDTGTTSATKAVDFNLNLTTTGNSYTDNTTLDTQSADATYNSTVTFSLTPA